MLEGVTKMEQWHESLETIGLGTIIIVAFYAWAKRADRRERLRREEWEMRNKARVSD